MNYFSVTGKAAVLLMISTYSPIAQSQDNDFDIGLRYNVLVGDGSPANDIHGYGLTGRYWLDNGWFAAAAIDTYEYDFEKPSGLVGIPQDPTVDVIDALGENTVLSGMIGRRFGETDGGFDWFWSAGVGIGFPEVADVDGPTDSGGTFDLTFDAKTEIHLMTALGTSYRFTPKWFVSLAARLEHHFIDITITDRTTGATRKQDSQTSIGGYLSLGYNF